MLKIHIYIYNWLSLTGWNNIFGGFCPTLFCLFTQTSPPWYSLGYKIKQKTKSKITHFSKNVQTNKQQHFTIKWTSKINFSNQWKALMSRDIRYFVISNITGWYTSFQLFVNATLWDTTWHFGNLAPLKWCRIIF